MANSSQDPFKVFSPQHLLHGLSDSVATIPGGREATAESQREEGSFSAGGRVQIPKYPASPSSASVALRRHSVCESGVHPWMLWVRL